MSINIEDDAFQLCSAYLEILVPVVNISLEKHPQFKTNLLYSNPQTPYFLEALGLLTFADELTTTNTVITNNLENVMKYLEGNPPEISLTGVMEFPRGFITVSFNRVKVEEWVKKKKDEIATNSIKPKCFLQDNCFFLELNGGIQRSLVFESDASKKKNMFNVFKLLFKHWQIHGDEVLQTKAILIELGLNFQGRTLLKNTIANIRKKIKSSGLADCVSIKYDRYQNGYSLKIAKPYL